MENSHCAGWTEGVLAALQEKKHEPVEAICQHEGKAGSRLADYIHKKGFQVSADSDAVPLRLVIMKGQQEAYSLWIFSNLKCLLRGAFIEQ